MARRGFGDACGAAHALELIGERWALLVLREMLLGPRRFTGLRADLPGISANVLTQRLAELEARGLVERRWLPPPASVQVYALTPWGREAEPILQAMGRWAARSPQHDPALPISAVSVLLLLRTLLDPARAAGIDAVIGFHFGKDDYVGRLKDGALTITRGTDAAPDVRFSGTPRAFAAAVHGGASLAALAAEGTLAIDGDAALARRFLTLFPLPPKLSD